MILKLLITSATYEQYDISFDFFSSRDKERMEISNNCLNLQKFLFYSITGSESFLLEQLKKIKDYNFISASLFYQENELFHLENGFIDIKTQNYNDILQTQVFFKNTKQEINFN